MKAIILPAAIFFMAAILVPLLKGKTQKIFIVSVSLLGMVYLFLLKAQTQWTFSFLGLNGVTLFKADKFSLFIGYIFGLIGFLITIYSIHVKKSEYHAFAFLYIGSALGVVFAGDFFSLYIFWELMALSAAALIWSKRDKESFQAGIRYLIMHLIGGISLLAGILMHYEASGGSIRLSSGITPGLPSALILTGVGLNAAFILLHTWLPDAYPKASFTASVLLSVYTTKSAVYVLARTFPGINVVAYMGAFMAVYGVTFALLQNNTRKLLSYILISSVGYMVAGVGMNTALSIDGSFFHILNGILYTSLLFMSIGAVIYVTGKENLAELGGLAKKMPLATTAAIVGALSASGVPLFNGFASKGMLFEAAHNNQILYLMLELASVGTFLAFLKFTYFGFLRKNDAIEAREAPVSMTAPMMATASLCILIGIYPYLMVNIFPRSTTFHFYSLERLIGSIQLLGATALIFYFAKRFFAPHKREILDFDYWYIKLANGFISLVKAMGVIGEYSSKIIFAITVDMWLPEPVSGIGVWRGRKNPKKKKGEQLLENTEGTIDKAIDGTAMASQKISKLASQVDTKIIDKLAVAPAILGQKASQIAERFDIRIVDGIVNGIGWLTQKAGKKLRPFQTGDVQFYALIMFIAAAILIILILFSITFRSFR